MTSIRSRLYDCRIFHSRVKPRAHQFVYRYFTFCLDLDEIAELSAGSWLFGCSLFKIFRFKPGDFFLGGHSSIEELKSKIRSFVFSKMERQVGRVEVIGHLRTFGYSYNPACFYVCYAETGEFLCSLLEVTNTFRERKVYYVPRANAHSTVSQSEEAKLFYVSPFVKLDSSFKFILKRPDQKLDIQIDSFDQEGLIVHSKLTGQSSDLSDSNLLRFLWKYPWVPLLVMIRIHYQAFKLYLKKVPFIRRNQQPHLQKGGLS